MVKNGHSHSGYKIIKLAVKNRLNNSGWKGTMEVSTEIVDWWESESSLIINFCGLFFTPGVWGGSDAFSSICLHQYVYLLVCSLVILFSQNSLIRFFTVKHH